MGDQQTFEPVGEDAAYGNGGYADANGGAQQSFARKQCPGKMFIGGLTPDTTDDMLREYFSQFGELSYVMVMRDKATGASKKFGFVHFTSRDGMTKVMAQATHTIDNRAVDVKPVVAKGPDGQPLPRTRKIFVGGVALATDEASLKKYFNQWGPVTETIVMIDKVTQKRRGFAFVGFEHEDYVDFLFDDHKDPFHELDGKRVEVKRGMAPGQQPAFNPMGQGMGYGMRPQGQMYGAGQQYGQGGPRGAAPQQYGGYNQGAQGGYGQAQNQWSAPQQGYGAPQQNQWNQPAAGAAAGGYGGQAGYGAQQGGYGGQQQQGGYGAQGGYAQGGYTAPAGGYTEGYGAQGGAAAGYGAAEKAPAAAPAAAAGGYGGDYAQQGQWSGAQAGGQQWSAAQTQGGGYGGGYAAPQAAGGYAAQPAYGAAAGGAAAPAARASLSGAAPQAASQRYRPY